MNWLQLITYFSIAYPSVKLSWHVLTTLSNTFKRERVVLCPVGKMKILKQAVAWGKSLVRSEIGTASGWRNRMVGICSNPRTGTFFFPVTNCNNCHNFPSPEKQKQKQQQLIWHQDESLSSFFTHIWHLL